MWSPSPEILPSPLGMSKYEGLLTSLFFDPGPPRFEPNLGQLFDQGSSEVTGNLLESADS